MRFLAAGNAAVLAETESTAEVLALYRRVAADPPRGIVELVPASSTLLLRFDASQTSAGRVIESVERIGRTPAPGAERPSAAIAAELVPERVLLIPVRYDGPDLGEVAAATGLQPGEVIAAHTGREWTVAFTGFAPGFGYLMGGDERLRVPRRTTPRVEVPRGSVGLAGEFSGVYPRPSPGGWQLIGRTELDVWDEHRSPPALLVPGRRVRFVEAAERS